MQAIARLLASLKPAARHAPATLLILLLLLGSLFSAVAAPAKNGKGVRKNGGRPRIQSEPPCGELVSGAISAAGETDTYTFPVQAGDRLFFNLWGTATDEGFQLRWEGQIPGNNFPAGGGAGQPVDLEFPQTGVFTLKLLDAALEKRGTYQFELLRFAPDARACATIPLTCGQTVNSTLQSAADVAHFSFPAEVGDLVTVTVVAPEDTFYPGLYLPNITSPRYYRDISNSATLTYRVTEPGTQAVFLYSAQPDTEDQTYGAYSVRVQWLFPASKRCQTTTPLTCAQVASGSINAVGESDFFTFQAEAGDQIILDNASQAGSNLAPLGLLVGPGDTFDNSTTGRHLVVKESGTYVLQLSDITWTRTGSYNVWFTFLRPAAKRCQSRTLVCGPNSGRIDARAEWDLYTIPLASGAPLTFRLQGVRGFLFAPDGNLVGGALSDGQLFSNASLPAGEYLLAVTNAAAASYVINRTDCQPSGSVFPPEGGNRGLVSVRIRRDEPFPPGTVTVKLTATGQPDVTGIYPRSVPEVGVAATFDLNGAPVGPRSVVLSFTGGETVTLADAFTVVPGQGADLYADVIGRERIRFGLEASYTIVVGNRGDADALGVPIWIRGLAPDTPWRLDDLQLLTPRTSPTAPVRDFSGIPMHVEENGEVAIPLILPIVPAGGTQRFRLALTVPEERDLSLSVVVQAPMVRPVSVTGSGGRIRVRGGAEGGLSEQERVELYNCLRTITVETVKIVMGAVLPASCENLYFQLALGTTVTAADAAAQTAAATTTPNAVAMSGAFANADVALTIAECAFGFVNPVKKLEIAIKLVKATLTIVQLLNDCMPAITTAIKRIQARSSLDPNDKVGPEGAGPERYLPDAAGMGYTLFFENVRTAALPARDVLVTDDLPLATYNLSTFSLGPIRVANKQATPPVGAQNWTTTLDLRPEQPFKVRITAGLNPATGRATWRFETLDPATNQPPDDPLVGFLPPNLTSPEGEGSVYFTVSAKEGLSSGTQLRNRARIVFDANPPIDTPEWINTLDHDLPASQAVMLPSSQSQRMFTVSWSGTDGTSGIGSYDLYVSDNGGPLKLWLAGATGGSAPFTGEWNHTYAFASRARDLAGNREALPMAGDASTQVVLTIDSLIAQVSSYRDAQPQQIKTKAAKTLLTELSQAKKLIRQRKLSKARNELKSGFLKQLNKARQKGTVTALAAADLKATANTLIAGLGSTRAAVFAATAPAAEEAGLAAWGENEGCPCRRKPSPAQEPADAAGKNPSVSKDGSNALLRKDPVP